MDPLEDVLALLDAASYLSTSMLVGGAWAVRFEPPSGVKFNSVRRGRCLIQVDGIAEPVVLERNDCFLLTQPRAFTLASDPAVPPVPARTVFAQAVNGIAHTGEGDDVMIIGGGFFFNERARTLLLCNLPPVVHVPAAAPEARTVRWALRHIGAELQQRPLGAGIVAEHLAMVMLVQVLRVHLAQHPAAAVGWLAGLTDPVAAPALHAMHDRPAHAWTVAELARTSRVSRSTFAARFKQVVGQGPLEYLTAWRIEIASRQLRRSTDTLETIARSAGYGSESALSTAFKRVTGMTPRDYRRRHVAAH